MKTLIELYDERPIENVLGTEMFRPEELVVLFPPETISEGKLRSLLTKYFEARDVKVKITVVPVSLLDASKVEKRLREILKEKKDCAIDISGGTDAALFAAGAASGDTPVITYSRRRNRFFEISNADFARNLECNVRLDARSCFLMAGGTLLPGREDNSLLKGRLDDIDRLFGIFSKYRKIWNRQISYIQQISSAEPGVLTAGGPLCIKADHGRVTAEPQLFYMLEKEKLISDLSVSGDGIEFQFPDEMTRFWLRDIGAVLELQVYRAALESGCFDDVVLSAVVNWDSGSGMRDAVTNEIDVMAVQGITPFFISCKTSEIKTEALNELAILRDRFGGKGSRAMIVTSQNATRSRAVMRMRAARLGIEVAEWGDTATKNLIERFRM